MTPIDQRPPGCVLYEEEASWQHPIAQPSASPSAPAREGYSRHITVRGGFSCGLKRFGPQAVSGLFA